MCDKTNNLESVNECHRALFCPKGKSIENIPPNEAALLQHYRRAIYQAMIWATTDQAQDDFHLQSFGDGQSPVGLETLLDFF